MYSISEIIKDFIMIKYLLLSVIGYFVLSRILMPYQATKKANSADFQKSSHGSKNNHEGEYVEYEEVE